MDYDTTQCAHLNNVRLGRPLVETVESSAIGRGATALVNNEYTCLYESKVNSTCTETKLNLMDQRRRHSYVTLQVRERSTHVPRLHGSHIPRRRQDRIPCLHIVQVVCPGFVELRVARSALARLPF